MKLLQNTQLLSFVALALIFAFVTGCGTGDDHGETPVGLVMSVNDNDNVLATQDGSTITYTTGDQISLNQGVTLGPILVEFLAEDGDRYLPDSNDGYSLKLSSADSNTVTLTQVSGADAWTVQLIGVMVGGTEITIELMHNGHSDFESLPFKVSVNSVQPQ